MGRPCCNRATKLAFNRGSVVQAEAAAAYEVWKRRDAAAWLIQRLYKRHIRRRAVYMMKGWPLALQINAPACSQMD